MKKMSVIILNTMQSEPFADILKDIAQIFFASVFIASLMGENINRWVGLLGLILSLLFWTINIAILEYIK